MSESAPAMGLAIIGIIIYLIASEQYLILGVLIMLWFITLLWNVK